MTYRYSCPKCSSRVNVCMGGHTPKAISCPYCEVMLVVLYQHRTLVDKIEDSATVSDFINSLADG